MFAISPSATINTANENPVAPYIAPNFASALLFAVAPIEAIKDASQSIQNPT